MRVNRRSFLTTMVIHWPLAQSGGSVRSTSKTKFELGQRPSCHKLTKARIANACMHLHEIVYNNTIYIYYMYIYVYDCIYIYIFITTQTCLIHVVSPVFPHKTVGHPQISSLSPSLIAPKRMGCASARRGWVPLPAARWMVPHSPSGGLPATFADCTRCRRPMAVERVVHRSPDLGPGVGPKDKGCERSI